MDRLGRALILFFWNTQAHRIGARNLGIRGVDDVDYDRCAHRRMRSFAEGIQLMVTTRVVEG